MVEVGVGLGDFDGGVGVVGNIDVGIGQMVKKYGFVDIGVVNEQDGVGVGNSGVYVDLGILVGQLGGKFLVGFNFMMELFF